jgi:hypothetical protein
MVNYSSDWGMMLLGVGFWELGVVGTQKLGQGIRKFGLREVQGENTGRDKACLVSLRENEAL